MRAVYSRQFTALGRPYSIRSRLTPFKLTPQIVEVPGRGCNEIGCVANNLNDISNAGDQQPPRLLEHRSR